MARQRVLNNEEQGRLKKTDALKQKHKGKSKSQITNADVMEWAKEKMVQELGIDEAV